MMAARVFVFGVLLSSMVPMSYGETPAPVSDAAHMRFVDGQAAARRGDWTAAEAALRDAVQQYDSLGPRPSAAELSGRVCALNALASLFNTMGRKTEAESTARRALREAEAPADTADTLVILAGVLAGQGDTAEADRLATRALKTFERTLGRDDPSVARALNVLADVRVAQGTLDDADVLLRRAESLAERGGSKAAQAAVAGRRGLLRLATGRYADAEPRLEQSLELAESSFGPDHPALVPVLQALGDCYRLRNRPAEAQGLYERALRLGERHYGPSHAVLLPAFSGLAVVVERQGAEARAAFLYARTVEVADARLDPRDARRATYLAAFAGYHARHRAPNEAEALYVQALAILDEAPRATRAQREAVLEGLRDLYASAGRRAEAGRLDRRLKALAQPRPIAAAWAEGDAWAAEARMAAE